MNGRNDRFIAGEIAWGNTPKAYLLRLCATWDVDVRIVSSWGTGVESICPDLTADFGGKIVELVGSL
jgi:hypothetical protein